ncbi:MAG: isochorismatase hydrolase [Promethearchaeota archaeon CR_4]|nr:MAG: isochorismatase hydrolase [Candidatus Lokiarchaeota archaeon CR_4]
MFQNPLLLIIDTQLGFFTKPKETLYVAEETLKKIKSLLTKARSAKIPVIFIQHDGLKGGSLDPAGPGWVIHPLIMPISGEQIIRKKTPSAFVGTSLDADLKKKSIKTLVIVGLQTEFCVDSTVRHASYLDYKVILAKDAHSTFDSSILKAPQIIAHHNMILGDDFAELKNESEIEFP